jgi:hypothetical protein
MSARRFSPSDRGEGASVSSPAIPPRFAAGPGRALATLAAAAAALVAAFVVVPPLVAGGPGGGFADERHLTDAVRAAFVGYWRSGRREFSPDLDRIVDYWFHFHVVKAAISAILLIALVALGVLLWKAFLRGGGLGTGKGAAHAASGVLVTILALVSLAALMANVQGAAAPFASLFPMLTDGAPDAELAATLEQARQLLAAAPGAGGRTPPALGALISGFSWYHAAMAVIASIVAVVLIGTSVLLWKRFAATASSDRRTRRVLGSFGVVAVLLSLATIVLVVANATTAADRGPALLALLEGGW